MTRRSIPRDLAPTGIPTSFSDCLAKRFHYGSLILHSTNLVDRSCRQRPRAADFTIGLLRKIMTIAFNCSNCGTPIRVAETAAGRNGTCAKCGQRIVVPHRTSVESRSPNEISDDDVATWLNSSPPKTESDPLQEPSITDDADGYQLAHEDSHLPNLLNADRDEEASSKRKLSSPDRSSSTFSSDLNKLPTYAKVIGIATLATCISTLMLWPGLKPVPNYGGIVGGLLLLLTIACFVVAGWVIPVVSGTRVLKRKGYSAHWMWFGIHPLFGYLMMTVAHFLPQRHQCHNCGGFFAKNFRMCPYCGIPKGKAE